MITEEQLKEWEKTFHKEREDRFLAYLCLQSFPSLIQAYREQQKEIERLKKKYEWVELREKENEERRAHDHQWRLECEKRPL